MNVRFVKMNPSGNTTIFILDQVPAEKREAVANAAMAYAGPGAEQVAFILPAPEEEAGCRMEMAGGEFCGNASRSFAAWLQLCPEGGMPHDFQPAEAERIIRVSGAAEPLTAKIVSRNADNRCYVSVAMPKPEVIRAGTDEWFGEYTIVWFNGITHVVLWNREPNDQDMEHIRPFLQQFDFLQEAFGLMYYNEETQFMRPLVCVENPYTLVWENSCGSGSSALVSALAHRKNGSVGPVEVHQPGGDLTVTASWNNGQVEELILGGEVEVAVVGNLFV